MPANNSNNKKELSAVYRWMVLLFTSLVMFGNYYIYDSISPLADLLATQLNFTDSDIGLLQAIYSIPNIFMVLIGGIIIDKFGTRISSILFSSLCLLGAVITSLKGDLVLMATGRLIFGLGAESLIVAITTVLARWFKGKELSFAFGLNLTIARLGSFAALNSPSWAKDLFDSWQLPLFLSIAAGVLSVLSVIVYIMMDINAEKKYILREVPKQEKINLKGIFSYNKSYWFIVLLCISFYSAIFPFQTFAIKYFIEAHGTSREFGGFLSSLLTLASMVLTPLFGLLSDYVGRRSQLLMLGSAILLPVYLLMVYSDLPLIYPMSLMGISLSLIPAIMWPSVALIIEENRLGTAYGLMTMIQQIGLAAFNFLIGWANDFSGGYSLGMWIFTALALLSLLFSILLFKVEKSSDSLGLEIGIK